ncbi:universal stress protein [Nocardia pseudobrasiliensis]|uniref:Nucleotide-binding universal stress UspA family protein n=1 Tax=Nocardia pseudobrasiliensis TaxID=45979 RepID=A0A370IC63_9NOCA|nr:universal stress protein [Nocardia pseudobrasiliensis]RDI68319.1 nucleotide-binding universal stress UspA family protein [Nocardia pseudobrasiliensis]
MTKPYSDIHHLASASVVVGVDGSPAAAAAVDWAADIAAHRRRTLRVVHGTSLEGLIRSYGRADSRVAPALAAIRVQAAALVEQAAQRVRAAHPAVRVTTQVSESSPAKLLVDASAQAYQVILGRGGAGFGSTLAAVTAHARGSVVAVDAIPEAGVRSGPVVVGIDGSPVSEAATAAAFEEAAERRAELVAVHIWNDLDLGWFEGVSEVALPIASIGESQRDVLAERLAGWQEKYPDVKVSRRLYPSGPVAVLRQRSQGAQLLVLGSRGRGGFLGMLLGSTSNALVRQAHCPVMVVHPNG